jgi:hypothetical protein
MQKKRNSTILELLGKQNNQSFAELKRVGHMGTESLVLGLKDLMDDKLVKKDLKTKRYSIQSDSTNKTLQLLKKNHEGYSSDPEILEKLRDEDFPFETGYTLLRTTMFTLTKLTLAQNDPDLTSFEKMEFKNQIKLHNKVIEKTFDILYSIDFDQTLAMKKGLDVAISEPQTELKLSGLANKKQKRKSKRL